MTNRSVRFAVGSALGLLLAGSGVAFAQDPPAAEGTTPPPAGETTPPPAGDAAGVAAASASGPLVTLRQGGISVDGDVVIGLSSGSAGKPISIVPNIYYGINDQLTVGISHNTVADIFQTAGSGLGLCLTGDGDGGCLKTYSNLSLDSLYSFLRSSTMDLAFHGGLDFLSLSDPTWLSLRLGVKGKTMAGPVQIIFDPSINIGLTERDFNKERILLPARFGFLVTPQLNLGVSIALAGFLDGFGDTYAVPLGIGGVFSLNNQFDLRAQFSFDQLIAANNSGADARTLSFGAAYRM